MIRPARDLIKVKVRETEEKKTVSGIYLPTPEENFKNLATADVVDVGPGYVNIQGIYIESAYAVGDVVMFKNHPNLDKVFDNGDYFLLVPSAEVCAWVEDDVVE